jgi:hypothetical protein
MLHKLIADDREVFIVRRRRVYNDKVNAMEGESADGEAVHSCESPRDCFSAYATDGGLALQLETKPLSKIGRHNAAGAGIEEKVDRRAPVDAGFQIEHIEERHLNDTMGSRRELHSRGRKLRPEESRSGGQEERRQDADGLEPDMSRGDSASPYSVRRSRRPQARLETSYTRTGRPRRHLRSSSGSRSASEGLVLLCNKLDTLS